VSGWGTSLRSGLAWRYGGTEVRGYGGTSPGFGLDQGRSVLRCLEDGLVILEGGCGIGVSLFGGLGEHPAGLLRGS
jgi:hypothetical protein